jgi:TatD DNase family protein
MQFSDTHCHIYTEQFDSDRKEVIERANNSGVGRLFLPNIDVASIEGMHNLASANPSVFAMMGLHPCSVSEDFKQVLNAMEKLLFEHPKRYVAVGEIGLDLYWDKTYKKEQEDAFRIQVKWAKKLNKPIVIHVRDAFDEILDLMDEIYEPGLSGIFHCFTGGESEVNRILAYKDFYFGIGGVVTFKNSGLDKVIPSIPKKRLVLETDSPYLAPHPNRGKRNEPSYINLVAQKLSTVLDMSLIELSAITEENTNRVFQL